jgi:2-iminobutanoate/2-iminopropanoate deaminase
VFVSGQIALDPVTQQVVDGDVGRHTDQALRNVDAILRAAGSDFDGVLRCVVYLTTMEHFAAMNRVYERFFAAEPPARTTIAVASLPRGSLVEIEVTARVLRRS